MPVKPSEVHRATRWGGTFCAAGSKPLTASTALPPFHQEGAVDGNRSSSSAAKKDDSMVSLLSHPLIAQLLMDAATKGM